MSFNNLITNADWSAKLNDLLDAAHQSLASKDDNADDLVRDAQADLTDFGRKCPFEQLSRIAKETVYDVGHLAITSAIASVMGHTQELENLTKGIAEVTDSDSVTAGLMRFDAAKTAVDAATDAVAALKQMRNQLDSGLKDEKKLGDTIDALMSDIQAVRNQIEVLDHPSQ